MAATKDDLRNWFQRAPFSSEAPYTHMVIVCDTYDWEDYPVYVRSAAEALDVQGRVMEIYDLNMDMETQMAEHRAWHL